MRILNRRLAGTTHAVVTTESPSRQYCKTPCAECPWRKSNVGNFPPEAFQHSASTSYDAARSTFACHMTGIDKPTTCAGFILSRGAEDNLSVRMSRIEGKMMDVTGNPKQLFSTYRRMAIANGVDPNDDVLTECMPEARDRKDRERRNTR